MAAGAPNKATTLELFASPLINSFLDKVTISSACDFLGFAFRDGIGPFSWSFLAICPIISSHRICVEQVICL